MAKELPVIQPGQRPSGQKPIFDKIGIVGLGLIGGSLALKARELWPTGLVIGVDNKDVLETAMRMHAIDVAAADLIMLDVAMELYDGPDAQRGFANTAKAFDANVEPPDMVFDGK